MYKMHLFTETGSGQTEGKLQKKSPFAAGHYADEEDKLRAYKEYLPPAPFNTHSLTRERVSCFKSSPLNLPLLNLESAPGFE
jgi:hypothetical protein